MTRRELVYLLLCLWMLVCAALPFVNRHPFSYRTDQNDQTQAKINWGAAYWHPTMTALTKLPLSSVEHRFAAGFPGDIARFADTGGIWVVRHVRQITRMLHPAADCYRGLGYRVGKPKILENRQSGRWRCFLAERGQTLRVCERIIDAENRQWTDVSSWYWENLLQTGEGEWWAITQVNAVTPGTVL